MDRSIYPGRGFRRFFCGGFWFSRERGRDGTGRDFATAHWSLRSVYHSAIHSVGFLLSWARLVDLSGSKRASTARQGKARRFLLFLFMGRWEYGICCIYLYWGYRYIYSDVDAPSLYLFLVGRFVNLFIISTCFLPPPFASFNCLVSCIDLKIIIRLLPTTLLPVSVSIDHYTEMTMIWVCVLYSTTTHAQHAELYTLHFPGYAVIASIFFKKNFQLLRQCSVCFFFFLLFFLGSEVLYSTYHIPWDASCSDFNCDSRMREH